MTPPDDGTVVVPISSSQDEGNAMPSADLPEAVAGHLITETMGNIQANNRDGRNIGTTGMGVLQLAAARNFDELGIKESRAVSGVMATPVASPATQQG